MKDKFKTVQQVAQETQSADRTVQNWCSENDVPFLGSGKRKQYMIYPEHEEQFKNREKPGRRWPVKTKKKK